MLNERESSQVQMDLQTRLEKLEAQGQSARWWRRTALALIVAALCFPFAADALGPVPNTFSSGEVISATKMNDNFKHLQNAITALETTPQITTQDYEASSTGEVVTTNAGPNWTFCFLTYTSVAAGGSCAAISDTGEWVLRANAFALTGSSAACGMKCVLLQ